jgi:hypothetical protein
MPTMQIFINGHSMGIAGGEDFDVLTFGFISGNESTKSTLLLTGYKKRSSENFEWLRALLGSTDSVSLVVQQDGQPTLGSYPWIWPENQNNVSEAGSKAGSKPDVPFLLNIHIGNQQQIRALANTKSSLQTTVTWHRSYERCELAVWSSPVNGKGEDHFCLKLPLDWESIMSCSTNP